MSCNIVAFFHFPLRALRMTSPFFVYPETSVLSVDDDHVEDPRARPEMQKRAPNSQDVVQSKDASDGGWGGGGFGRQSSFSCQIHAMQLISCIKHA